VSGQTIWLGRDLAQRRGAVVLGQQVEHRALGPSAGTLVHGLEVVDVSSAVLIARPDRQLSNTRGSM
jgi:hypothetical protein